MKTTVRMKVREVRLAKRPHWSQHDLAKRSGLQQPALCRIEGGHVKSPTIETVVRLADALGVEVTELFERT